MMSSSLTESWTELVEELAKAPRVVASLRPPAATSSLAALQQQATTPLPVDIIQLYALHDGADARLDDGYYGFTFVDDMRFLTIAEVSQHLPTIEAMSSTWPTASRAIPIGREETGMFLAVAIDTRPSILRYFPDAPPVREFENLGDLVREVTMAIRDQSENFEADLTRERGLRWVNVFDE